MWSPEPVPATRPRYLGIAEAIARDVEAGRLQGGERLPTHRELANTLAIAVGTVTRAYAEAERRGLVRGEVGRGTFVRGGEPEGPFGAPPAAGPDVIDLGLNVPVYETDPDLASTLRTLARRRDLGQLLRYQPHAGLPRHREAGALWARQFGLDAGADRVLVCAGAQHALTVILTTIAQPGDRILTEALTYPGLKALASLLRLRLEGLAMDDEGVRPDALEEALHRGGARALYCMPTLQNPTTGILSEERRRTIAAIARAHDLAVIEDDVHRLLVPDAPPPIAELAPERSYFVAGMAKSVAGALRVAYLVAPPAMVDRLTQAIWATIWMATPLTAEIAATWITDGTAARTLERKRREAAARQRLARAHLGGQSYRSTPQAFHVWLELPDPWRSESFAREARRRGVVVTPAEAFAVGRSPVPHCVRIALGAAETRGQLERALGILAELLAEAPGPGPAVV